MKVKLELELSKEEAAKVTMVVLKAHPEIGIKIQKALLINIITKGEK